MKIDRSNYEVFFLDYIEGNLSPELVAELHVFLALNPDLDEELRGLDQSVLFNSDEVFDLKDSLKKSELPVSQEELDEMLISELDGLASQEVIAKLDQWSAQYHVIAIQRAAMQQTRLAPGSETFDFKSLLRFDQTPDMSQTDMLLAGNVEGDLTAEQQTDLQNRMQVDESVSHSHAAIQKARLTVDRVVYDEKGGIQIPDSVDYSDIRNLLIAKVEGDLNREQNERLSAALAANPSLQQELQQFYKTRLQPEAIVYEGKSSLHQNETPVVPMRRILSIVASIAAVLILVFWIGSNDAGHQGQMASTHQPDPSWNNQPNAAPGGETQPGISSDEVVSDPSLKEESHNRPNHLANHNEPMEELNHAEESQSRNVVPLSPLKSRMASENALAFTHRKDIALPTPDMSVVHAGENDVANNQTTPTQSAKDPATIWQLLGEAAADRLEKTAAFALVERQVEKVTPNNPEKYKVERIDKQDKSKLHMKLGKLEVNRDTKKKGNSKGRLERIIDRFVKV